jgi:hypothetical protein
MEVNMTTSKLAAAMVAGFLMGQAFGSCDRNPTPASCGCDDATGTSSESAPGPLRDNRAAPSPGRRPGHRGGAAHRVMQCNTAPADTVAE